MARYGVFESGKPAKFPECKVHPSWDNNVFSTVSAAEEYAIKWLGSFWDPKHRLMPSVKLNVPYDFNGYGDTLDP